MLELEEVSLIYCGWNAGDKYEEILKVTDVLLCFAKFNFRSYETVLNTRVV